MRVPETSAIFFLFFLLFFLQACITSYSAEDNRSAIVSPRIEISSVYGRLDTTGPSTVAMVLYNNATVPGGAQEADPDPDPAKANGIVAELVSDDNRIHVLSDPQMAGSLNPGENITVEFMALAEDAEVGIYPARLRISYSWIDRISTSGEKVAPDIILVYEDGSLELPLQVGVVRGAEVEIEEIKGAATPGRESLLEVVVANNGDETAFGLQLEARAIPPFIQTESRRDEQAEPKSMNGVNLEPGSKASFDLAVRTHANATPGYCPLPGSISYSIYSPGDGGVIKGEEIQRSRDLILLVAVKEDTHSDLDTWLLLPAGLFVILLLLVSYFYFWRNRSGRSNRANRANRTNKSSAPCRKKRHWRRLLG